ncbi:AAA domain-containing protein [Odoribacter splanchnicus]|jgi:ATP-dependent RNA/DNA helicase IGHMBP2|uniref:AAA domain-containing protein n=1 Tax=Odoribacter splanchnicus TaxID=28118 RepID=UPI000623A985|nr:AAA domain-containing protein [Odoribacter splanchnicus]MDB9212273.1 AAA domain-containing protein [Odoribacter splanchnicus]MDB9228104.1 AAA domain-containing protein [Odoribacter splanchnicus]MDB9238799.1 AAA domain-containing protein [Odoribacter splanchnicus]MDB9242904.1 AAA domain-containing protein [Odoribacter splanchnicus]OUN97448.1 helicase [Odoribacter splanchnicus]
MDKLLSPMQDLQQQSAMLQKEYEYEKELYRQQTREAGIPKRIQQGVCWFPVKLGADRYNSLNQLTVEVTRTETEETEHSFEYGRPVCFFRISADRQIRYFNFSAVISYVQDNKMVVVLPGPQVLPELVVTGELGVQLYFDDTSYKTMFAALREVAEAKGNRTARLREVLLGKAPALRRETGPVRFPWLNASQEKAVNQVLCAKEVAVVHGPPGTGKTTTLVEAVYETLHRENQVMVSAQSNTAVDWIAEKLVDRGIPVLRIGNPTRVNDKMLAFTYERRFEAHSDYPELWQIRKTIREMTGRLRKSGREDRERLHNQLTKLRVRATGLEIRIDTELFTEARVIACTLVGAASRVLERKRFSSLFIDEAAQAIEAACWIAISRADRVILAGDHCQLPPTIKCIEAARGGLGRTLLEKVVLHKPETMSLLKIQYRMHEDIMRFPSRWFYHDELEAAPEVKYRGILDFDTPVSWIDTSELDLQEKAVAEGTGRLNTGEAELLVRELKNYMERIGIRRILEEHIDFGVISPYRAQVHYLRHLLKKEPFFRPCRRLITVHTVDGFQGQERDVIMISLVRANEKGQIGFLRDLRRMNVAITRARMKLLILGEAVTLTRHPFYRELYEYIGELR